MPASRRLGSDRAAAGLGALGTSLLVAAAVLPWRTDGMIDPDPLSELVSDSPWFAVPYAAAVLAAATAVTLLVISPMARRLVVGVGVTAAVAALVTLVATPLPSGNAIGMTSDGRTVEVDVATYRSWGGYLAAAGGLLVLTAVLRAGRPRRTPARPQVATALGTEERPGPRG